jgi:hypothetical protein
MRWSIEIRINVPGEPPLCDTLGKCESGRLEVVSTIRNWVRRRGRIVTRGTWRRRRSGNLGSVRTIDLPPRRTEKSLR